MRALCGAIITAGALIGLGLTALAFGVRFYTLGAQTHENLPKEGQIVGVPTMVICLVVLLISVIVGFGIAFLGLMYHHERRHYELHGHADAGRATRSEAANRVM
jgi:hypothetical protein